MNVLNFHADLLDELINMIVITTPYHRPSKTNKCKSVFRLIAIVIIKWNFLAMWTKRIISCIMQFSRKFMYWTYKHTFSVHITMKSFDWFDSLSHVLLVDRLHVELLAILSLKFYNIVRLNIFCWLFSICYF